MSIITLIGDLFPLFGFTISTKTPYANILFIEMKESAGITAYRRDTVKDIWDIRYHYIETDTHQPGNYWSAYDLDSGKTVAIASALGSEWACFLEKPPGGGGALFLIHGVEADP